MPATLLPPRIRYMPLLPADLQERIDTIFEKFPEISGLEFSFFFNDDILYHLAGIELLVDLDGAPQAESWDILFDREPRYRDRDLTASLAKLICQTDLASGAEAILHDAGFPTGSYHVTATLMPGGAILAHDDIVGHAMSVAEEIEDRIARGDRLPDDLIAPLGTLILPEPESQHHKIRLQGPGKAAWETWAALNRPRLEGMERCTGYGLSAPFGAGAGSAAA